MPDKATIMALPPGTLVYLDVRLDTLLFNHYARIVPGPYQHGYIWVQLIPAEPSLQLPDSIGRVCWDRIQAYGPALVPGACAACMGVPPVPITPEQWALKRRSHAV